jgi:hypothetical protein
MSENDNKTDDFEPSDEQILAGVRRHLSDVEPSLPRPRAYDAHAVASSALGRSRVRPRIGFVGLAPLVLVAALVVVAVGLGMSLRSPGPAAPSGNTYRPAGVVTIIYQLEGQLSASDLDNTVAVLSRRLSQIFPQMASSDAAGSPMHESTGYTVTPEPPDRVVVSFQAAFRAVYGSTDLWDLDLIRAALGQPGRVDIVALPTAFYGTVGLPSVKRLPQRGDRIDPALPSQLTDADFDMSGVTEGTAVDGGITVDIALKGTAAGAWADYVAANDGQYLAVAIDGNVFETSPISGSAPDGHLLLSNSLKDTDALKLTWLLKSGSLPVPLSEVSFSSSSQVPASSRLEATPTQVLPSPPAPSASGSN